MPPTPPPTPGGGHTKEEIIAASKKTSVKLYENDDCSGDELEFPVSHSEQNCKYCLDTCFERYTTDPDKDVQGWGENDRGVSTQ